MSAKNDRKGMVRHLILANSLHKMTATNTECVRVETTMISWRYSFKLVGHLTRQLAMTNKTSKIIEQNQMAHLCMQQHAKCVPTSEREGGRAFVMMTPMRGAMVLEVAVMTSGQ